MFDTVRQIYLHRERERLYKKQSWKELADVCLKLVEIDGNDFKTLHDLVVALREIKDYARAGPWCEALLKIAPQAAPEQQMALEGPRYLRYLVVCGEILLRQGELERARALLTPLKKAGHHFHRKHLLLSELYQKKGDLCAAAAELEEMQESYSSVNVHQWEHVILVRSREVLAEALRTRDPDAATIAYRTITKTCLRRGDVAKYIDARRADPALRLEVQCLEATAALLKGDAVPALKAIDAIEWPELADRLRAWLFADQGRALECAVILRRMAVGSRLRFELARRIRGQLRDSPDFLRDYAECHLSAGYIEEAYEAYQTLTTRVACEVADLQRRREIQELLLDRNIWEDEARLGLLASLSTPGAGRPGLGSVETVPLRHGGGELRVRVSTAFRLSARRPLSDPEEARLRLAENCLRRGVKRDAAVRILQELSRREGPYRARALCLLTLYYIRHGEGSQAQDALKSFSDAALPAEERMRLLLDIGDACEAAGLAQMAKTCYEGILRIEPAYADVQERLKALEAWARPASSVPEKASPSPRPSGETGSGRIRDRYADLRAIGRGGMGVVYKAFDPLYARTVALKVLPERYRGEEAAVSRFLREGQAMAQLLRHPGIVRVYEVGSGHDLYIAMEFVQGESLRVLLRKKGWLPAEQIVDIGCQVCEALSFAHRNGVIHRDVKPDNILLTADGKIKVVDFGLADVASATVLTQSGSVIGTGAYMSPEQVQGLEADRRSDIYSLGATLFEMAAGQPPFPKGDMGYQHVHAVPPSLRGLNKAVAAAFEAVVFKCLAKDPANRFQSCDELEKALKEAR